MGTPAPAVMVIILMAMLKMRHSLFHWIVCPSFNQFHGHCHSRYKESPIAR